MGDAEGRVGVGRVLADGAYDSRANFNFPAGEGDKARHRGQEWLRAER